jgi:hypothetical protein
MPPLQINNYLIITPENNSAGFAEIAILADKNKRQKMFHVEHF